MNDMQPLTLFDQVEVIAIVPMTAAEARACADEIRAGINNLRAKLLELYEREGWRALGYDSWRECAKQEFELGQRHAYNLLSAAEVERNLCTIVQNQQPIPETHLRPLVALEPDQQIEVWQAVIDTAPQGKITAAHVKATVAKIKGKPVAKLDVHYSSETPEHYTPDEILDAVIECMGMIDLDPCSNSHDTPHVPATHHYTKEDNGLLQPWHGRVFMNPPYGDEIAKWVAKLCSEEAIGNVTEAIALVPARTDTDWFSQLINDYRFVCYVHGRLKFVDSEGNTQGSAPFPSAIVYLGTEFGKFYYNFAGFGRICQEAYPGVTFAD